MRILICGGGTGGHIYPALAAVTELNRLGVPPENVLWIGTRGEIEETLIPMAGLRLETIIGGAIVGVPLRTRLVNAAKLIWSLGTSSRLIGAFKPDVLLMTGGYVNVPVALVTRLRRIPAAIYLPDVEPGLAIKTLSRLAKKVACTTEASRQYFAPGQAEVTGYPVRPELRAAVERPLAAALASFELTPARKTLFVFGGSRGARSINRALLAALPELLERLQIIHISGTLDWPEVEAQARRLTDEQRAFYRPYPYLHEEMGDAFRSADLVVARAGASMLGECPAFGLPAMMVPYPYAWRYQRVNADYLAQRGAAIRLDDETLPQTLTHTVLDLVQDEARLAGMAAAAKALDVPDSAARLAQLLWKMGKEAENG